MHEISPGKNTGRTRYFYFTLSKLFKVNLSWGAEGHSADFFLLDVVTLMCFVFVVSLLCNSMLVTLWLKMQLFEP